jgi:hypothetical protein
MTGRGAPTILRVRVDDRELLVAPSRSEPGRAYVLRPGPDGRLVCQCKGWTIRGRCAHVDAVERAPQPSHSVLADNNGHGPPRRHG